MSDRDSFERTQGPTQFEQLIGPNSRARIQEVIPRHSGRLPGGSDDMPSVPFREMRGSGPALDPAQTQCADRLQDEIKKLARDMQVIMDWTQTHPYPPEVMDQMYQQVEQEAQQIQQLRQQQGRCV